MGVDAVPPDFTFWGMIAALLAAGVIDVAQAGAGFANASSLSILALYAVSAGVEQTGALDSVVARVLGRTRSAPFALARMVLPVAAASGFLSNLAVVSLLVRKVMGKKKSPKPTPSLFVVPRRTPPPLTPPATTAHTMINALPHPSPTSRRCRR
jgi:energy-converting hydrogenase Eha subunit C